MCVRVCVRTCVRVCACVRVCVCVWVAYVREKVVCHVCLLVSPSLNLVDFGNILCYTDKKNIVNIMKAYIERYNLQDELIRCRNKCCLYSRLLFRIDG